MLRICQINYPEAAFHGHAVKTVAYLRVSTPPQDVSSQRLAILEYAQKHVPQPPARPARPLAGGQRVAGKGGIANQAGAGDVGVGDRHDSVRNKGSFPPYYQPNDLDARNPVGETLKATVSDPTCAHLVASNVPSVISGTPIKRPIMNS